MSVRDLIWLVLVLGAFAADDLLIGDEDYIPNVITVVEADASNARRSKQMIATTKDGWTFIAPVGGMGEDGYAYLLNVDKDGRVACQPERGDDDV